MGTISADKIRERAEKHRKLAKLYELIEENPELMADLLDLVDERTPTNAAGPTAEPGLAKPKPRKSGWQNDERRPTEEYRQDLANAVIAITSAKHFAMDSQDLYPELKKGGFPLREENDSPKGLGKILAVLWKAGLLQRTANRSYYPPNVQLKKEQNENE